MIDVIMAIWLCMLIMLITITVILLDIFIIHLICEDKQQYKNDKDDKK